MKRDPRSESWEIPTFKKPLEKDNPQKKAKKKQKEKGKGTKTDF